MSSVLPLSFKAERRYLHGSDFFQVLSDWAVSEYGSEAYLSRLSFRRLARNCCMVVLEKPSADLLIGEGEVTSPIVRSPFWLIETDKPVTERRPFEETGITAGMMLREAERAVELSEINGNAIDEVIFLTKQLNYAISPEVDGSWLFGQLQLEMPLQRAGRPLRIVMRSLLANRFSVNDIYYGDQRVGNIRFIVGKS
jgi:hypothetical protein